MSFINYALLTTGALASVRVLLKRHQWEQANQRTAIVLDYDDALAVSTRAGLPLREFLPMAHANGATHLSLPELTLKRLLQEGRLALTIPAQPISTPAPLGRWVYLTSVEPDLLQHLATELQARLPASQAQFSTAPLQLSFSGELSTIAEMGLGFETAVAAEIMLAGLGLVPRPVSFAWPEDHLVERTLAQVKGLGAELVAFEGDLILGHEMHLETTVTCLENFGLTFAYFSETRHQKGDWFIAKRLALRGQVILAHYFSPAALVPEDFHSAAHHWGMLAHARGIRLCYVNVFRRIHATDPLECLEYLDHIRTNLNAYDGQTIAEVIAAPNREQLALTGLVSAGTLSLAANRVLEIPEPYATGLTVASVAGALALPYLDQPRGELERAYPPSYAPKMLALAAASAAPLAADPNAAPLEALLQTSVIQAATATALATFTTGQDYQQHIEEYRSFNADLFVPLAGTLYRELRNSRGKWWALAGLGIGWYVTRRFAPDVLGGLDRDLPAGHTHHLSAFQRMLGDALILLGPRPGRKWSGLGLAGVALASALRGSDQKAATRMASLAGVIGNALMLAAFRRPERPLSETLPVVVKSWAGLGWLGFIFQWLKNMHR